MLTHTYTTKMLKPYPYSYYRSSMYTKTLRYILTQYWHLAVPSLVDASSIVNIPFFPMSPLSAASRNLNNECN